MATSVIPGSETFAFAEFVDARELEILRALELTKQNRAGEEVLDEENLRRKVYDTVITREVTTKEDRNENAWTRGELYAAVLPGAPGTQAGFNPDELSEVDREVMARLTRRVWNLTNPGRVGHIQKRLAEAGTKVLCRYKVWRDVDELPGCYVTDNPDLIMSDSVQPEIEKLVRQAENLRAHADMIIERHPELAERMALAIGTGVRRSRAVLPAVPKPGQARLGAAPTEGEGQA